MVDRIGNEGENSRQPSPTKACGTTTVENGRGRPQPRRTVERPRLTSVLVIVAGVSVVLACWSGCCGKARRGVVGQKDLSPESTGRCIYIYISGRATYSSRAVIRSSALG